MPGTCRWAERVWFASAAVPLVYWAFVGAGARTFQQRVTGQLGNVALSGRRDSFFRPLRNIRENDIIRVTTYGGHYRYRVVTSVVTPDLRSTTSACNQAKEA